jgi:hypothetical protein
VYDLVLVVFESDSISWSIKALASNIPYLNLLILNEIQSIVAIFLAADFLKRDKKLDTSEVFYVRPLSNAEYVIGKIWGNVRVFLILNLVVMVLSVLFNFIAPNTPIDWMAYLIYFLLISIPTLVYIIGLSVFSMQVFRNQALTFILLLGYVGFSHLYLTHKYHFLFDYIAYYFPLVKSSIVGFTNWGDILAHRFIYLSAGLAFIFTTIAMFGRLPNSARKNYLWPTAAFLMLLTSGFTAYKYMDSLSEKGKMRAFYTSINNKYVHAPKALIETYAISLEQKAASFNAEAQMKGIALQTASVFTFCLNPGLQVREITGATGETLSFEREEQIILVDLGKETAAGDTISLTIKYAGKILDAFCYLDIPHEELQKPNRVNDIFTSDKQYAFQTGNFLLFTPETYWYPRAGTAYSNESPDWQQTYFSRYKLKIKPLPGLIPLSQGEAVENADGSYSFLPEYPLQALSLIAGKYKQQSLTVDSVQYNIRYFEGHDYYTAAFDALQDTLSSIIRDYKLSMERKYKLDYPFSRLSLVEVPAQFFSYKHAWSKADETMQPEMFFITEKAWTNPLFNVAKSIKNQKRRSSRSGVGETDEEMQVAILSRILWEYSLFPQLYNFQFNVFSSDWPIANKVIEYYLQNPQSDTDADENSSMSAMSSAAYILNNENNEMTGYEKANLLMGKHHFKDLLARDEYREFMDFFIESKSNWLFAPAEINQGMIAFRDSVYAVLERNTFRNMQFEHLLDTLGNISRTDILSQIAGWNQPVDLPAYTVSNPVVSQYTHRDKEVYVMKLLVSNHSDNDGMIQLTIRENKPSATRSDPKINRKLRLSAHQTRQLVSVWDEAPKEVEINTMISGNIPAVITYPIVDINKEKGVITDIEGDYILPDRGWNTADEMIIDNEDSLFSFSAPVIMGLLPKWLNKTNDKAFKYSGYSWWRPPIQWSATTNQAYYGRNIRSAYLVKSGSGNKTATWKYPVLSPGDYEVYYFVSKSNDSRGNNRSGDTYHFRIINDMETEDAYLNMQNAGNGWESLGVYYFHSDTVGIVLTNENKGRTVVADAVKIVKK